MINASPDSQIQERLSIQITIFFSIHPLFPSLNSLSAAHNLPHKTAPDPPPSESPYSKDETDSQNSRPGSA